MNESLEKLLQNKYSTVVAKFEPSEKKESFYQSEAQLESSFIKQLVNQGYEYADFIKDEESLKANLKKQVERLNECEFSPNEWERFFSQIGKENDEVEDKTELIQKYHLKHFAFDNGKSQNIKLVDKRDLQNNHLQVISQISIKTNTNSLNRYDVSILVNGLPLVHIELKRRGVNLKEAFNQIKRYGRESFFEESSLFNFIQIFIISNGTYTKYYSNTIRKNHIKASKNGSPHSDSFEFTSFWADSQNKQIFDLSDFSETFLAKRTLLNVLFKYCVFDSNKNLLVMRPYQIAAAEAITHKVLMNVNYKSYGKDSANGYIWHSTGSGKTLTSFKTAQLITELNLVKKVLFVVDRKDLDNQTVNEYNKFEENCVDLNTSTKILEKNLNSDKKIIVTTIQKLSYFVKSNKKHSLFDEPCVIIFDECHRSQFGEMNAQIKKAFKKYLLFGFTGTPIMEQNKAKNVFMQSDGRLLQNALTTESVFNERLHSYTIANAIKDKNVLPFKVDYVNVLPKFKNEEQNLFDEFDEKQARIKESKELLNHKDRIKKIVSYVLEKFDSKTYRSGTHKTAQDKRILGFNSIFASSSIDSAKLYYNEFKAQMRDLDENKRLKIATIFSCASNEDIDDNENIESVENLPKTSREFLDSAIRDYNEMFESNFSSSGEFANYYNDVSKKLKEKKLDMLIVVDMFLTGFDAKTLNTLWVDKNLRYHGLLQAYSRTNRILDSTKNFGNIVCFRNLEARTNESITLFSSGNDDSRVVLMRTFKEYFEGYFEEKIDKNGLVVKEFKNGYKQIVEHIQSFDIHHLDTLEEKKEFVKAFNELLKIENILSVFDEFSEDKKLLSQREKQDLASMYLGIKDWFDTQKTPTNTALFDGVVFEIELLQNRADITIDIDFIHKLLEKAKKESDKEKQEAILEEISRWVDSSLKLRNKRDLIKDFARYFINLKGSDESLIDEEFQKFVKKSKKDELLAFIEKERLNQQRAIAFVENAFKNKEMSNLGVEFAEILPKVSLFDTQSKTNADNVFEGLCHFYEKYKDISGYEL